MKASSVLLGLAAVVTAGANYISVTSVRSGSPIQYRPFTARGERIYLGGTTASYCPETIEEQGGTCPPGNETTFSAGSYGSISMGASVPGGQQVYVEECTGEIGYTIAHSASVPEDAILDGWTYRATGGPAGLGSLSFKYPLIACPQNDSSYQVFAQVPDVAFIETCLGMDTIAANATGPSAWEYT